MGKASGSDSSEAPAVRSEQCVQESNLYWQRIHRGILLAHVSENDCQVWNWDSCIQSDLPDLSPEALHSRWRYCL